MQYKALKWEVRENPDRPGEKSIGIITMNRPEALNAVDVRMRVELDILCDEIVHNSHIRVIILTGEGRGFSAGGAWQRLRGLARGKVARHPADR